MTGDGTVRALTGLFSRVGLRRPLPGESLNDRDVSPAGPSEVGGSTKTLRKFLACLAGRQNPRLLDLGPVVGSNVEFFGERLGCRIFVEDLLAELERPDRNGLGDSRPYLPDRITGNSVDGVLCWDVFDYLEPRAAERLARELVSVLRPGGPLLGFFNTATRAAAPYTRFILEDETRFRHQPYGPTRSKGRALHSRDIVKMFDGLTVKDLFLLKTHTREILFKKPGANRHE